MLAKRANALKKAANRKSSTRVLQPQSKKSRKDMKDVLEGLGKEVNLALLNAEGLLDEK